MHFTDNVRTFDPTHILVKVDGEPVLGFAISYPDGSHIDEIDADWQSFEEEGYLAEDDEPTHGWMFNFHLMGSVNLRVACPVTHLLKSLALVPDPEIDWDNEPEDLLHVTFQDITEAEWETHHAFLGLTLVEVHLADQGSLLTEVYYPREDIRTQEQIDEIASRRKTYAEILDL